MQADFSPIFVLEQRYRLRSARPYRNFWFAYPFGTSRSSAVPGLSANYISWSQNETVACVLSAVGRRLPRAKRRSHYPDRALPAEERYARSSLTRQRRSGGDGLPHLRRGVTFGGERPHWLRSPLRAHDVRRLSQCAQGHSLRHRRIEWRRDERL